jgi:cellulose biosynthesis protein BcsQ
MLISTWSDKGGTGKTTLAILAGMHFDANLLDLDPQGDLLRWAEKAKRPCSVVTSRRQQALIDAAESDAITVVDCPPGTDPSSLQGMAFSQVVIIPTRSGDADLVALARALEAVATIQQNGNPGLVPTVVLNAIRDTARAHGIAKALAVSRSYTYIGEIKERVAYEESYAAGTTVLASTNGLAATEATEVLRRLEGVLASLKGNSRRTKGKTSTEAKRAHAK